MSNNAFIRTGAAIIEINRIKKTCRNIAENYCVKIAFAKAIGTGMRVVRARDISVLRDRLGSPFIMTSGYAKMLEDREGYVFNVSVAHCKNYATASVVLNK